MAVNKILPLALGALAASSGLALLTFDIVFSIGLSRYSSKGVARPVAIVASALESVTVLLLVLLIGRHVRYRNGAHIQDLGHGRRNTYLISGVGSMFGALAAAASASTLAMIKSKTDLPTKIAGTSVQRLAVGGFIAWGVVLISQSAFLICMVVIQRKDFQQQIQPYRTENDIARQAEMQASTPAASNIRQGIAYNEKVSMESRSPPPSSGRSRAETITSVRSSFSQGVRPSNSRTKLINKPSQRATTTESPRDRTPAEDGFDSWDTSTVDPHSRRAVESVSPTPPRFLETIPASPTGSRSPSPGFPLDLQPPKTRHRSQSYSPANSHKDLSRSMLARSPENQTHEAHIHPLFRKDSPTPPPFVTPGTMVTAAPGAGRVISDRESIRSISRMRSGSLPSSPMVHSSSLESIKVAIEREERERLDTGIERTLTPPIPDFVLNSRSSMTVYLKRKASGGQGEIGEAF